MNLTKRQCEHFKDGGRFKVAKKDVEKILLERAMTILQYSEGENELVEELKDKLAEDYQDYLESQQAGVWHSKRYALERH